MDIVYYRDYRHLSAMFISVKTKIIAIVVIGLILTAFAIHIFGIHIYH